MKINSLLLSSLVLGLGLTASLQAKPKDHWVCMKDSAEVPVQGKTPADKKKACLDQAGKWDKAAAGKDAPKEQSSGTGGAW